jgi:hypothetical protein
MDNYEVIEFLKDKLRTFFRKRGIFEVDVQNSVSILNGSLDTKNIIKFEHEGLKYPVPQTFVFSMEDDFSNSPNGVYCFTDVYHYDENNKPIQKIVCEFIMGGGDLAINKFNSDIITSFGLSIPMTLNYVDILRKYSVDRITDDIRLRINDGLGNSVTIKDAPVEESKNWFINMSEGEYQTKEVILNGHSTIHYYQLVENLLDNFQSFDNGKLKDVLLKEFDGERIYGEINKLDEINLTHRFLGQLDIMQLSKSFKPKG